MLDAMLGFNEALLSQPPWLLIWLGWMGAVNLASLAFLGRREARWVLAGFVLGFLLMTALFAWNGYNRLLGLGHVVFWTPVAVMLWRSGAVQEATGGFGYWVRVAFATYVVSLVVAYVDVARYLLGDRG